METSDLPCLQIVFTKTRINSDKYNTRDLKTKTHKQYDLWVFPFQPKAVNKLTEFFAN